MKTRRRALECDCLETRALLSGSPGHLGAMDQAQAQAARAVHHSARHAHVASLNATAIKSASVTGGGLVNVPNAPVNADILALQAVASANNLVRFLGQFEALSGSNAANKQLALSLLNDAQNVDLALNGFAGQVATTLPGNLVGNDQALAKQMIAAAARRKGVDQAFSSLIVQAETNLAGQLSQLSTSAQDASIRAFATGLLPTVQADFAAAQGTGTLAPVSTTPSSTTLNTTDLNTLATYYAINVMERFLGQVTMLVTKQSRLSLYSAKLIGDHEQGALVLGGYAASTGTYLPASIPSAVAPMASSVIAALRRIRPATTTPYDRVYLTQMIMGHSDALKLTAQVIATSQNPTLKQFAVNVESTIFMHLLAAKSLKNTIG